MTAVTNSYGDSEDPNVIIYKMPSLFWSADHQAGEQGNKAGEEGVLRHIEQCPCSPVPGLAGVEGPG